MILTDDDVIAENCRGLRNLCFQPEKRFIHERLGWNLRMTNLQAAIGLAQLERLDDFVLRKRTMGLKYTELFSDLLSVQLPLECTQYSENIYWVFGLLIKESAGINAQEMMKKLAARGIGTRPFFYPMHKQPVLMRMGLFKGESYPVAEMLYRQGFYIPSGLALTDSQINYSAQVVREILV